MCSLRILLAVFFVAGAAFAGGIKPQSFDLAMVRNASTLETRVIQDWKPAPNDAAIRQKLIEITVCEWWAGQKVRLPVTFNIPAGKGPVRHVILSNSGLGLRPALPVGSMLRLLKEHGVGVVLIGMGPIEAMSPVGKLHTGMKEHLLQTKDARYTPAWIWALSDMRALTAAVAEKSVFQPEKVLATGGSKRGIGAAGAAVHDDRFTGILPVVAPPLGNPGEPYVLGSGPEDLAAIDAAFLAKLKAGKMPNLPASARTALAERDQRRGNERITVGQARAAGWSESEIAAMNDRAWDVSRVAAHLDALHKRGVAIFYNVGSNDNVSPDLLALGQRHPAFPIFIVPGGQHGGPTTTGFTRQVPSQPGVEENLYTFARHHFFAERAMVGPPQIEASWDIANRRLRVTARFADGQEPEKNELAYSLDRHPPGTLPFEYDRWEQVPMEKTGPANFSASVPIPAGQSVEFLTTHNHAANGLPLAFSSALFRQALK